MDIVLLKQSLVMLLPVLGAILKRIPWVNNQAIPWILAVFASVKTYWIAAGLPVELIAPLEPVADVAMAGFFDYVNPQALISIAWGGVEAYIATRFHKSYKYRADSKGFERPRWV